MKISCSTLLFTLILSLTGCSLDTHPAYVGGGSNGTGSRDIRGLGFGELSPDKEDNQVDELSPEESNSGE